MYDDEYGLKLQPTDKLNLNRIKLSPVFTNKKTGNNWFKKKMHKLKMFLKHTDHKKLHKGQTKNIKHKTTTLKGLNYAKNR